MGICIIIVTGNASESIIMLTVIEKATFKMNVEDQVISLGHNSLKYENL
jgi:hypothetical protein